MSNEIKSCFESYVTYMKSNHLKKIDNNYLEEIQFMTNSQIGSEVDLIHMQYILSTSFSISKTAPAYLAYNHLKKMIDTDDINKKCIQLEINITNMKTENDSLRNELSKMTETETENDSLRNELSKLKSKMTESETKILTTNIDSTPKSRGWIFN